MRRAPPRPGGASPAAGFTLLELVIALAIAGLVVGAVYAAVDTATSAHDRNLAQQAEARRERNVRAIVSALLRSARLDPAAPGTAFVGSEGEASGGDQLGFSTVIGIPLGGWEAGERVRARLSAGREGLQLEIVPEDGAGRPDTLDLLPRVTAIEARYREPGSGEWLYAWDRSDALPDAVALAFEADPPIPTLLVEVPAVAVPARPGPGPRVGDRTHPGPETEQ